MIQRIQTLYLLISVILGSLLFFTPVAVISDASVINPIYVTEIQGLGIWYLFLFFMPCLILPLYQVFLFRNRKKQITIGKYSVFLWFLWATFFAFICYFLIGKNTTTASFSPAFGAILPLLSIVFILLANRAIKKDEELVRSIDRIR